MLVVAAALAATIMGPGCAGGSDEDQVRETLADVRQTFADRDWGALCELMTPGARRHVGMIAHGPVTTCPEDMRDLVGFIVEGRRAQKLDGSPPAPEVVGIAVTGDRAVVLLRSDSGAAGRIPFARRDGEWKVDAFYGDIPGGRQKERYP